MRALLLACACACACGASSPARSARPAPPVTPVVDLHVDWGYALHARHASPAAPGEDASLARLRAGHVRALVIPLFVGGAEAMSPAGVRAEYDATYRDLLAARAELPPFVLAFEGADGFAGDPAAADVWVARGACFFGLVHSRANALGGASQDVRPEARARGLTAEGRVLAEHLVARGAVLDVAHASDAAAAELIAIAGSAGAPVVDSHTGMRGLRDTARNLGDAEARAIARTGGVIGISMHESHTGGRAGEAGTLDDVAAHVIYAVRVAGAGHVGIGSDFEGNITPPRDADGEASWPALAARLRARGLSAEDVERVMHRNAERVLAWARAHGCGGAPKNRVFRHGAARAAP